MSVSAERRIHRGNAIAIQDGLTAQVRTFVPEAVLQRPTVKLPPVAGWSAYDQITGVVPYDSQGGYPPATVSAVHGRLRLNLAQRELTLTPLIPKDNGFDAGKPIILDFEQQGPQSYLGWPDHVLARDGMEVVAAVLWRGASENPLIHRNVISVKPGEIQPQISTRIAEPTPAQIRATYESFSAGQDRARIESGDATIDVVYATRKRIRERGASEADISELQVAVEQLPLFTGERAAGAIVDTLDFAYMSNGMNAPSYDALFSASATALAAFAGNPDRDNIALLLPHRERLESLMAQLVLSKSHEAELEAIEPIVKVLRLREAGAPVASNNGDELLQRVLAGLRKL